MIGKVAKPSLAVLCEGVAMKVLFRISSERWTAAVRKVKPGTFVDPDLTLGVELCCDGVQILRRGFNAEFGDTASTSRKRPGAAFAYAELFEFALSKLDRHNLRFLVFVLCEVCEWLEQGGSVEGWLERHGLLPVCDRRNTRRRTGLHPLLVQIKKDIFVVSPRRFLSAKKRKP